MTANVPVNFLFDVRNNMNVVSYDDSGKKGTQSSLRACLQGEMVTLESGFP